MISSMSSERRGVKKTKRKGLTPAPPSGFIVTFCCCWASRKDIDIPPKLHSLFNSILVPVFTYPPNSQILSVVIVGHSRACGS